jgi:hypothetical protein
MKERSLYGNRRIYGNASEGRATAFDDGGRDTLRQFKQAKKEQDNLTPGQDVAEATLPISMAQSLVRKYVRLHLDS